MLNGQKTSQISLQKPERLKTRERYGKLAEDETSAQSKDDLLRLAREELSNGQRIYHSGDSDATPEMKKVQTDVALMPCGGTYTMTAAEMGMRTSAKSRTLKGRPTPARMPPAR